MGVLAFPVQQTWISILDTNELILLLKHSEIIAEHMVKAHFLIALSSTECNNSSSMEQWKLRNDLGDLKQKLIMCRKFQAALIDIQEEKKERYAQPKPIWVFQRAHLLIFVQT